MSAAGQGGKRGAAASPACAVAAKPTVMLATGIGCCGPQVVLVQTSKGHENTTHFPPSIPSFAFPLSPPPREAHLRCGGIFQPRKSETACLQGRHDKVQEQTRERREKGSKWRGEAAGSLEERDEPAYCVTSGDRENFVHYIFY